MTRRIPPTPTLLATIALTAAATVLAGCQTSPATGRQFFSSMSSSEEASLGKEEHSKILEEFGGAYTERPALNTYVNQVGQFVAQHAERKDVKYTFTVLDTEEINAFALPGGYVYVTRGLLTLANNEAEVAGVLGHEIGHVNARHTAERAGQQTGAQWGVIGATLLGAVLGGDQGAQLLGGIATEGAEDMLGHYSQQQEFEADSLGVRYLGRSGYDPQAMATFLDSLDNDTHLEAKLAGNEAAADSYSMKQSHPRTPDRVQRAIQEANEPVANPVVNRDQLLGEIDGMIWGDDPREGVVKGATFVHPALRFAFDAPKGMKLANSPSEVVGKSDGAAMIFDLASPAPTGALTQYVASGWQKGATIADVEALEVNGMEAATGVAKGTLNDTPVAIRMVAIRQSPKAVYRFLFVSLPENFTAMDQRFLASAQSFREITAEAAAGYRPKRIRVVTVAAGDTVASLSNRMQTDSAKADWFRVLNHLPANAKLAVGQKVKLVVEDDARVSVTPTIGDALAEAE